MREWKSIRDTEEFKVPTREWIRKIGHQDFFDLDPEDLPEPSENEYTPSIPPGEFEVREDDPIPEPEEEAAASTRRGSMDTGENVPLDGVDMPVPDDGFFGDAVYFQDHFCQNYQWEIDITPSSDVDKDQFVSPDAYVLAAVNERKKKSEVRLKELSQDDQKHLRLPSTSRRDYIIEQYGKLHKARFQNTP